MLKFEEPFSLLSPLSKKATAFRRRTLTTDHESLVVWLVRPTNNTTPGSLIQKEITAVRLIPGRRLPRGVCSETHVIRSHVFDPGPQLNLAPLRTGVGRSPEISFRISEAEIPRMYLWLPVVTRPVRVVYHFRRKLRPLVSYLSPRTSPLDCLYNPCSLLFHRALRPSRTPQHPVEVLHRTRLGHVWLSGIVV